MTAEIRFRDRVETVYPQVGARTNRGAYVQAVAFTVGSDLEAAGRFTVHQPPSQTTPALLS